MGSCNIPQKKENNNGSWEFGKSCAIATSIIWVNITHIWRYLWYDMYSLSNTMMDENSLHQYLTYCHKTGTDLFCQFNSIQFNIHLFITNTEIGDQMVFKDISCHEMSPVCQHQILKHSRISPMFLSIPALLTVQASILTVGQFQQKSC